MIENQPTNSTIQLLLEKVEKRLGEERPPEMAEETIDTIARQVAAYAQSLIHQHAAERMEASLSREVEAGELSAEQCETVCRMASRLASDEIVDGEAAMAVLKKHGFEIREFAATTFVPNDPRLQQAPSAWLFEQSQTGLISPEVTQSKNILMICEVRRKPDVLNDRCWVQMPYEGDPFQEQLVALHGQLDGYKTEKKIDPTSRAGFTFHELVTHVLPLLSEKMGVTLTCMPALYACILANDHPEMSNGRSTEWREETSSAEHALISGRSDRGPIRYVYYDAKSDPYPNRGFRLCVLLGPASDFPST